jgi:hypothetical protein
MGPVIARSCLSLLSYSVSTGIMPYQPVFATADPHHREGRFYRCGQPTLHLCLSFPIPPTCVSRFVSRRCLASADLRRRGDWFVRLLTRFSTLDFAVRLFNQLFVSHSFEKKCCLLQPLVRRAECRSLGRSSANAFADCLSCYSLPFSPSSTSSFPTALLC